MTEAEVYSMPAMHLSKEPKSATFYYVYAPEPSFKTSWKTFIMGQNIGDIVESSLVENLNPSTDFSDMDWIKPGVAAFPWWGNYLANSYIDTLKMYVDLAAEMKWEWLEFDVSLINTPFHSSKEWEDVTWIPELTAYAREKNMLVYGWDEIKVLDNKAGRDFVFDRYKEMGLDGIKIDYIDSDSKYAMMFRDTACAEAAKRKMMVSFHGETLPYDINDGDKIRMENFYTVAQLFEFLDLDYKTLNVTVNNEPADKNTKVYENFTVRTSSLEEYNENIMASEKLQESEKTDDKVAEEPVIQPLDITITVNGQSVVLSGKPDYIVVDLFQFYPFDLTMVRGNLVFLHNGNDADYSSPLNDGDVIELR